jgi:branched-chain amino acid transport system substrate-binding protein
MIAGKEQSDGVNGHISVTPTEHNGYPDDEVVMIRANSFRDGAFSLAPGYSARPAM